MHRSLRAVVVSLVCCLAVLPVAGAKLRAKDILLDDDYPPISEEHGALKEVSWAPGSPAVYLLLAEQNEWDGGNAGIDFLRNHYFRRLKILSDDAVEQYGSFRFSMWGGYRIREVDARTVLPDGTVVDAKDDIIRERDDDGSQVVIVNFPQVQVGAILDFHLTLTIDSWRVSPWIIQQELPVLESRFVIIPPVGLRFRTAVVQLPPEANKSQTVALGPRGKAQVFRFTDVEPLPQEPNLPPREDLAQRLFVILDSYKSSFAFFNIASDWKTFAESEREDWDEWLGGSHGKTASLGASVAAEAATPRDKAEAIRRAARQRVQVNWVAYWPSRQSADEVLEKGSGNTADLAGLTAAMLRAAGVDAGLAYIRRRSSGTLPPSFPIPALLNDVLVTIPGKDGPVYFSPASDLAVGKLPFECSGILAMPLDGVSDKPVALPEYTASQNSTNRVVEATLDASGKLTAESHQTHTGAAADAWRSRLRDKSEEEQRELVQDVFERGLPGVSVAAVEIENLDDASRRLKIRATWEVSGYATRAGKRLLLNPNMFARISATDWAAESRVNPVDLGQAYDVTDTLMLSLPEGVEDVTLPELARLDAQAVGIYESSAEKRGSKVVAKRHMRLSIFRFPAEHYPQLRQWFSTIAIADDRPLVVTVQ